MFDELTKTEKTIMKWTTIICSLMLSFAIGYTVCDRQWHNEHPVTKLDAYQNYVEKTEKFIDELYDLYPIDDKGNAACEYYEARKSIGLECPL